VRGEAANRAGGRGDKGWGAGAAEEVAFLKESCLFLRLVPLVLFVQRKSDGVFGSRGFICARSTGWDGNWAYR
jgi:hypothetical protein